MTATKCECSYYKVQDDSTGCTASTRNTFAPGHDAKLKSLLIRSHGQEIWDTRGVSTDSSNVANRFGFGYQVTAGIEKAARKSEKRVTKREKTVLAPEKTTPQDENDAFNQALREVQAERNAAIEAAPTGLVKAKVGRWVKEGNITPDGFTYYDAKHVAQTTTKYTLV